jgi:hypothetical protein
MRIRSAAALLGVLALAGCGSSSNETAPNVPPLVSVSTPAQSPTPTPSETPSGTPSSTVADTLCTRADQMLVRTTLAAPVVQIQPKAVPAEFGLPTYDACELNLSTNPSGPVLRMGISVLPATKAELTAAQKSYDATRGKLEASKPAAVGQGGFGTSRFVVFLLGGKLLKVSGPPATLAKYVVLAQEAARQAPGLPVAQPLITRDDCERGTSEAAAVMGVPAMVRRDGETAAGDVVCGWITATSVLSSSARTVPDAVKVIEAARKAPTSESVPLGDEGLFNTATGAVTLRVGADKIVDLVPLPAGKASKDAMIGFALAISPLYTR